MQNEKEEVIKTETTQKETIPLSVPNISGNEWKYIKNCLDTGWVSSVGSYVNQFEKAITEFTGAQYGIACMNGTSAIHISLMLSGVQRNDYVIVPNITFVASCNAIHYTGADPLLIDADKETWQMDLDLLEEFLESKTYGKNGYRYYSADHRRIAGILPVHVLGNMCDMNTLRFISEKYDLFIVEDATEALGSYYKGKHSGTFGKSGTFSFNGNKIITTGGGGMIITDDADLARKAKHLTTQAKTDHFEYVHDEIGYNYRLVNLLAAMGVAQMELLPSFLERKKIIDHMYRSSLESIDLSFQKITDHVLPNYWLQTIRVNDQKRMISHLLENNIQCRPFWVPMNQLRMFENVPYITKSDISNELYNNCISIPSSTNLTDDQVERVIDVISHFK